MGSVSRRYGGGRKFLTLCLELFIVDNMNKLKKDFTSPRLITEEITNYLRESIVSGAFKEGEKLSEPRLQEMFQTSRSPIREAFSTLEQEGLIIRAPRRGAFVNKIILEELNETTIVVAILEGLAARLAIPNLTNSDLRKMERLVKDMEREVDRYVIDEYTITHNKFHEVFVSKCGNDILAELIGKLRKRYVRPKVTSYYFKHNIKAAVSSHIRIIEVLKQGNPRAAENAIKNHVMRGLVTDRNLWGEEK